ncbi:hypothetical protein, partial [Klebsiella michiganensis]|uniref:hypothetical protein n=2 Tax=Klebsiella michiganensis TaxID=1134687 RepID=UPI0026E0CB65
SREENRSKASGSAPSPEAARCACPGYRSADGGEPVARLSAAQAGKKTAARHQAAHLSRRRRVAPVRATDPQAVVNP